jgi:ABC-type bacteriocin/lantibiotic exporter with double-glycine peptidase domain
VLKDCLLNAKINLLLNGAVHVGSAIMMFAAARLMAGNSFGLGDFSLFIAHLDTLADCVNRIVELVAESRKAEVSYERINNIVGNENAKALNADAGVYLRRDPDPVQQELIKKPLASFEAKNLSFDYGEGKGFKNVSFMIRPGELMVVSGEIGSGKSTLLSVLMGILSQDSGELILDGLIVNANHSEFGAIAGAPQRGGFFSKTLNENLCLGFPASHDDIKEALAIAALDEMASPENLGLDLGSRASKLSGGQQQRLCLARMFIRGAQLNIIDDCVSALDEDTRMKVLHRLSAYLKQTNCSAIIATNDAAFVEAADQVLFMEHRVV